MSWPKNAIRAGLSRLAPIPLLGHDPTGRAVTNLAQLRPSWLRRSKGPVGAKLADPFAEGSKGESLQEASCNVWQVRGKLSGWRSLAVFVGCGAIGLGGFKPRTGGDMACIRSPLGTRGCHNP